MSVLTWLLDLLYPPKCPFCQCILPHPRDALCSRCQTILPWLEGDQALRPLDFTAGCLSPLAYRDPVRESIHRYKFPGNPSYTRTYGLLVAQCIQDHRQNAPDLVTWAPISRRRKRRRGFDQGERLARVVAAELGLPLLSTLSKNRDTPPQSGLSETAQRRANVLGVYGLKEGVSLSGKTVLLIDDVVTSGSTLSECARVLLEGGAREVFCATLAQARKN